AVGIGAVEQAVVVVVEAVRAAAGLADEEAGRAAGHAVRRIAGLRERHHAVAADGHAAVGARRPVGGGAVAERGARGRGAAGADLGGRAGGVRGVAVVRRALPVGGAVRDAHRAGHRRREVIAGVAVAAGRLRRVDRRVAAEEAVAHPAARADVLADRAGGDAI